MTPSPHLQRRCTNPTCPGVIEEGYCNVCGLPAGAAPTGIQAAPAPRAAQPSEHSTPVAPPTSARLASSVLGSARISGAAGGTARAAGSSSTRLRERRLGAGLTTVPLVAEPDPVQAVLTAPEVPEAKRLCPTCGSEVGRSRDGVPGRTEGYCPKCGGVFDFDPRLEPGDIVAGQYEIMGCLAHGGLGWIYLGRDHNVSGRWVVLKGLLNSADADAAAAAVAERRFLAQVKHPNIVEIYNFVMAGTDGYIVMEYVGGSSLTEILKERRRANGGTPDPLPIDHALAYMLEILPAVAYLHDHGLLYCDLKPDNMLAHGDSVTLIDLGGVRHIDDHSSAIFGTVGYQAPEVGETGPSISSDIYTIGRTLASLVLDFRGNTTTHVASLPPVSETTIFQENDSFYRLLAKACALDPTDRFAGIDEMRTQLVGVLREVVATHRSEPAGHSAPSLLFDLPSADAPDRPLHWSELPGLRADAHDPMASWLVGVNATSPDSLLDALAHAPHENTEVHLARAFAAIHVRHWAILEQAIAHILHNDPWEWRAAWVEGLGALACGDAMSARASFNAVYGQVPGELAPKLALATACELSHEPQIAESLYMVCARTDANYTGPAAFGMARIRVARGALDQAIAALDLVTPTSPSYVDARLRRAALLASSGTGLVALSQALESVSHVAVSHRDRVRLQTGVWTSALGVVRSSGPDPRVVIGGIPATKTALRKAVERSLRELASVTSEREERIDLIDQANRVRPWTVL